MLIKGKIIDAETKQPIRVAKVRVFKGQDDTTRYQTMTQDDGMFVLVVPDTFPITEASGQKTLQFLATHWEYNPAEMTITTLSGRGDISDGFEVWMQPWGGRIKGQTKAYTSVIVLTLVLLALSLLYARVNFPGSSATLDTSTVRAQTATALSELQKKAVARTINPDEGIVAGNRHSTMSQLPDCPGYNGMSPANLVSFATETAAMQAGVSQGAELSITDTGS